MKLAISKLSISNFRTFQDLTIEGLGRVNLVTGRNNTGKSSVLEAIRILTSDGSQFVLDDILRKREEYSVEANYTERLADGERLFEMSALFSGFPNLSSKLAPIEISSCWHPSKHQTPQAQTAGHRSARMQDRLCSNDTV